MAGMALVGGPGPAALMVPRGAPPPGAAGGVFTGYATGVPGGGAPGGFGGGPGSASMLQQPRNLGLAQHQQQQHQQYHGYAHPAHVAAGMAVAPFGAAGLQPPPPPPRGLPSTPPPGAGAALGHGHALQQQQQQQQHSAAYRSAPLPHGTSPYPPSGSQGRATPGAASGAPGLARPMPTPVAGGGANGGTGAAAAGAGSAAYGGPRGSSTPGADAAPLDAEGGGGSQAEGTTSVTVKLRGLPYRSSPADILAFFSGYQFLPDSLQLGLDSAGRPSGEAWLSFVSPGEAQRAVQDLNRRYLGPRYLELSTC